MNAKERTLLSVFLPQFSEVLRRREQAHKERNAGRQRATPPEDDIEDKGPTTGREVKEGWGAREQEALEKLARWAYRFTPLTAVDAGPLGDERFFGINLDLTGCGRLFASAEARLPLYHNSMVAATAQQKECESEQARRSVSATKGLIVIAEKLQQSLSRRNVPSRIAIAPTLGAAWALSRYGRQPLEVVTKRDLRSALSPLPVEALRLSKEIVESLREINVREIGQLLVLPRKALPLRFGKELLKRIDQALGIEEEVIRPVSLHTQLRREVTFYSPVLSLPPLQRAAQFLLRQLLAELIPQEKRILRLGLQLNPSSDVPISRSITMTVPSADETHLLSLLNTQLEALHSLMALKWRQKEEQGRTEEGGIESLSLSIEKAVDARPVRSSLFPKTAEENLSFEKEFGQLIDTLTERLGAEKILCMDTSASYIPEQACQFLSLRERLSQPSRPSHPVPILAADRPSVLFRPAFPIRAISVMPDGPPFWLKWRDIVFRVQRAYGPERIAPEWWRIPTGENASELRMSRDYFKVQLPSGIWLWIYREVETSLWFLQGIWS